MTHSIEWHLDSNEEIHGVISCFASEDASCHQCDEGCAHSPDQTTHVECLAAADIMETGAELLYVGNRVGMHPGPIAMAKDSSSEWVWWYSEEHIPYLSGWEN